MLDKYDSSKPPTLEEELASARGNPIEPGGHHGLFSIPGVGMMGDPESEIEFMMPMIQNLTETRELSHRYDYWPELLSLHLYGTHELWVLLMRLNGALTKGEFVGPRFKILSQGYETEYLRACAEAKKRATEARKKPIVYKDLTIRQVRI